MPWQPSRDGHKTKQWACARLDMCKQQISIRAVLEPTVKDCLTPATYHPQTFMYLSDLEQSSRRMLKVAMTLEECLCITAALFYCRQNTIKAKPLSQTTI